MLIQQILMWNLTLFLCLVFPGNDHNLVGGGDSHIDMVYVYVPAFWGYFWQKLRTFGGYFWQKLRIFWGFFLTKICVVINVLSKLLKKNLNRIKTPYLSNLGQKWYTDEGIIGLYTTTWNIHDAKIGKICGKMYGVMSCSIDVCAYLWNYCMLIVLSDSKHEMQFVILFNM